MTVAELREKLSLFRDDAQVWMLFDAPYRIESHSIENVTLTPTSDRYALEHCGEGKVFLEWRCG